MFSKKIVIISFVVVQLILIFFYIYTQSVIIQLTYSFQDAERTFQELHKRKKSLTHDLLQAQEAQKLKTYATQDLAMKKARLSDIMDSTSLTMSGQ
jgi:cell division protein FtsL